MGKSVQMKHSSPYPLPSPLPGTTVACFATVRSDLTGMTVGAGVALALLLVGPGRGIVTSSWRVEGTVLSDDSCGRSSAGPGVAEEREDAEGERRRFLLDME